MTARTGLPCRGPTCKQQFVIWAVDPRTGAKVPLEEVSTYHLGADPQGNATCARDPERRYISHFLTCPDRALFSKHRR